MIQWIVAGFFLFVAVVVFFIKKKNKHDHYIDLDSRLSKVKSTWDSCCKKITKFFGV